jgi:hypothetical protein
MISWISNNDNFSIKQFSWMILWTYEKAFYSNYEWIKIKYLSDTSFLIKSRFYLSTDIQVTWTKDANTIEKKMNFRY